MNKKIILLASLMLLVGIVGFVYAEITNGELNPAGIDGSVELWKGWNLVTLYSIPQLISDNLAEYDKNKLSEMSIKAAFVYDRINNQYIQLYPRVQSESEKLNAYIRALGFDNTEESRTSGKYGAWANSAIWIYTDKKQSVSYHTVDGPMYLNFVLLKQGWNFLAMTPEMVGKNIRELKGSCIIEKAYGWEPDRKVWNDLLDESLPEEATGAGFIIKVSNDCKMGSDNPIAPPTLPLDCQDSDGGKNVNLKGTTTGIDWRNKQVSYTDVCEDLNIYDNYLREYYCLDDVVQNEGNFCPSGTTCKNGACIGGNTGNIQILEQDFGQLKFNTRLGQNYIEREYRSFPLDQMIRGDGAKYGSEVGVNIIIIESSGDKVSFLNKVLNVYSSNWNSQLLSPPAYPRMYKITYKSDSTNEIALWMSSNYLVIVHGKSIFVDGSDAEQIIEDYLNKYPSTLQ